MKSVTVLSGKGGVGKSSMTASLAIALSKYKKIVCADCDVDASNLALVLGIKERDYQDYHPISTNQKVKFDLEKCNSCGKCFQACYFNAIKFDGKPKLKEFSCEGCGVCELVCPTGAIEMIDVDNAMVGYAKTKYNFDVHFAQLMAGESGSGKIVTLVKNNARKTEAELLLVDSSAGVGCPVIASLAGSNYAVLVTEPTPSGFSDMKRALAVVNHFKIPYGIIINKYDINRGITKEISEFAEANSSEILAKISYDLNFVAALVNLTPVIEYNKKFESIFSELAKKVIRRLENP